MRLFALVLVPLLLVPLVVRADETDPEPPGGKVSLRQLEGTWSVARAVFKGMEKKAPPITYTFKGDKATYDMQGRVMYTSKIEIDRKQANVFTMTREGSKVAQRYFFKIEKGELYLLPNRSDDPKAKPDFSGNTAPVLILEKAKK